MRKRKIQSRDIQSKDSYGRSSERNVPRRRSSRHDEDYDTENRNYGRFEEEENRFEDDEDYRRPRSRYEEEEEYEEDFDQDYDEEMNEERHNRRHDIYDTDEQWEPEYEHDEENYALRRYAQKDYSAPQRGIKQIKSRRDEEIYGSYRNTNERQKYSEEPKDKYGRQSKYSPGETSRRGMASVPVNKKHSETSSRFGTKRKEDVSPRSGRAKRRNSNR